MTLAACGNASSGVLGGGGSAMCYPGTQTQLANPVPNQGGVASNIGQIVIVANGNNNALYNSYGQFQTSLVDNFGNLITGGPLSLVADPSGPHPFQSDFYASSIPQLPAGSTWRAYLTMSNGSCSPLPVGSFST
ncbi:MAG: hypothetical protein GIW99_07285 [Candidatus Eremiobacteraeota bacterium]|nr:hypothetical protein [Candidatus Eremiobacteraeota bacterium]MBC5827466.1 hypothetical protein [Candidatus Eremiobacteraeota bacterium]